MFISVNLGNKLYRHLIIPIPFIFYGYFFFQMIDKTKFTIHNEITLLLNIRTGSWVTQRFLEKTISLTCFDGSGLNDIFHLKAQLDIRFRSSISIAESLQLSIKTENINVSSVNIFILDWIPSGISVTKIRKNSGPNIEP